MTALAASKAPKVAPHDDKAQIAKVLPIATFASAKIVEGMCNRSGRAHPSAEDFQKSPIPGLAAQLLLAWFPTVGEVSPKMMLSFQFVAMLREYIAAQPVANYGTPSVVK